MKTTRSPHCLARPSLCPAAAMTSAAARSPAAALPTAAAPRPPPCAAGDGGIERSGEGETGARVAGRQVRSAAAANCRRRPPPPLGAANRRRRPLPPPRSFPPTADAARGRRRPCHSLGLGSDAARIREHEAEQRTSWEGRARAVRGGGGPSWRREEPREWRREQARDWGGERAGIGLGFHQIGRASCRERVCQYV